MTEQEIKDRAPSGASHYWLSYRTYNVYYFKIKDGKLFMWNGIKQWFSESSFSLAIKPL